METPERFQITISVYGVMEREVKSGQNSGRIFVPKAWIGKKVKVVLIEKL